MLKYHGMIAIIAITAALVGALALVAYSLRKAPIGYEDQTGFHVLQRVKGSAIRRYREPDVVATASLKPAKAHP